LLFTGKERTMPSRQEDRYRRANERQEIRNKRTPQEQLKILDERFGDGKGAVRERARLRVLIAKNGEDSKQEESPSNK
jgi:hypothetical protein